ncbi:MAG: hypothetical protein UHJ11_05075 [Paludibacteraceae bacterium]|nr:hypothetical protein [Paludibacteraceae bacterium]
MKKVLIAFSAVMIMTLGFQSSASAQTLLGIVIKSNTVTGEVCTNGNGTHVFAEFRNRTNETVYINWKITVNGEVIGSGTCTVEPQDTCRTRSFAKTNNLSAYDVVWSY